MRTFNLLLIGLLTTSLLTAQPYGKGLIFNDEEYDRMMMSAPLIKGDYLVPPSHSLLPYCPSPGSQGLTGTCTAWALAYAAMTIIEAKQLGLSGNQINQATFSPAFLYEKIKDPADYLCKDGSQLENGMEVLRDYGVPREIHLPFACNPSISDDILTLASQNRIQGFKVLFRRNSDALQKINTVKKTISENKPVVIGFNTPKSFHEAKDTWSPHENENHENDYGGHAMVVIAYDDNKYGGAFQFFNSWGSNWGNNGLTWVTYKDFASYTKYAYELIEMPVKIQPVPPPAPHPHPQPMPQPIPIAQVMPLSGELSFKLTDGRSMEVSGLTHLGKTQKPDYLADEPLVTYVMNQTYYTGTQFRFFLSNFGEAYVYAIATDLTGQINRIFPQRDDISPYLGYSKNTIVFPSETGYIRMDETKGIDFLCFFYTKEPLDYHQLINDLSNARGSVSHRIQQVLGTRLLSNDRIRFNPRQLSFEATIGASETSKIIPIILAIEHN